MNETRNPPPGGSGDSRVIQVDALARVEGEGALYVRVRGDVVEEVKFRIFEPPRFFEAFLQGRHFTEVPDITARICGICPVAYIMGSSNAMEDALGVEVTGPLRDLRRALYCGEWIQSHVLHAAMLHAPDFLGLQDSLQIARQNPDLVTKALRLKKLGNDLMQAIGGRSVHPVNTRVGGFYKAPRKKDLRALSGELEWGVEAAAELARAFGAFDFPDFEADYTYVSMRHEDEYAIQAGRLVSNRGLDIPVREFPDHFQEIHLPHSNALHGVMRDGMMGEGGAYMVGPNARYNNNYGQLSDTARQIAKEAGLGPACHNPYKSILVRLVETAYACEEAGRLIERYDEPDAPAVDCAPRAGEGHGVTEAPRGICYHRYRIDGEGAVLEANIVPPTSQNQPRIEADLRAVVEANLDMGEEDLKWRCEQAIRNYDPCISCATHFLDLTIDRVPA